MASNPDDTKPPSSLPPKPHSTLPPDPNSTSYTLEKFRLYETRARFYLIGYDRLKRFYHVLKIDRSERCDLSISEDPVVYSQQEVKNLLQRVGEGNRATGGLSALGKVYGIVGCIKFLESYYLIVVTKRRQIGAICGHPIYSIEESQMITVPHSSVQSDIANSKTELRYKKLLSTVDLTKDFFYSYTYPIMQSLQKNVAEKRNDKDMMSYQNMFVWNAFLTEPIRSRCHNTFWTIALVHGSFQQSRMAIYGREFIIILISRRSRHFAGTRYLKRGVNDCGWVANDVETEQIVLDEEAGTSRGRMSSVVQMRGSIPLFWSQEASRFSPKPDIILQRYDPTYQATILHFQDLFKRYGNPVIVLTLIKTVEKRPREMMLRREYANAVGYLNHILPEENYIRFIHWDFHKFSKSKTSNVLAVLGVVASEALELTGFYYSRKPALVKKVGSQLSRTSTRDSSLSDHRANSGDLSRVNGSIQTPNSNVPNQKERDSILKIEADTGSCFQRGVLRTNCIDCLDRTNVAQYAYGLVALGHQLHVMGLTNLNKVDPDSSIAALLMDMYANMGDALAHQYGGSAAHNTVFTERQGKWKATTQSREFLKSIKRYYSNTYTDGEKQDAINLFLGYFKPQEGKPALWELDSDYYLHVTGVGVEPDFDLCKSSSDVHIDSVGNNLTRVIACQPDTLPTGEFRNSLAPVPACKQDFTRKKLTSFDKLLDTTGSATKNVRLCIDSDQKTICGVSNGVMAPDAAEIQLKSPNWLFGHRKYGENISRSKTVSSDDRGGQSESDLKEDKIWDLGLLSMVNNEGDIFQRYLKITSLDGDKSWYGGTLIYGQDESSEVYRHYAQLCQGPAIEPFENDPEKERHYREALCMGVDDTSDYLVHEEMKAAMEGYSGIGADLGIGPACKDFAQDPSQLTRWIIGEEKFQGRN